jgi:hypothetical protein
LFQLRLRFVPGERIGIAEIDATQVLTNHLHANERAIMPYGIAPSRFDTRAHIAFGWRKMFCIRLHFVLEERIGVEKISAKRFLTMDEAARLSL